jgi:hypothetical protein
VLSQRGNSPTERPVKESPSLSFHRSLQHIHRFVREIDVFEPSGPLSESATYSTTLFWRKRAWRENGRKPAHVSALDRAYPASLLLPATNSRIDPRKCKAACLYKMQETADNGLPFPPWFMFQIWQSNVRRRGGRQLDFGIICIPTLQAYQSDFKSQDMSFAKHIPSFTRDDK